MALVQPPVAPGDRAWRAKHEAILAAAHEMFISRGYNGTTMKGLAVRSRCSVGYLYKHFPGKQEILDALCTEYLDLYLSIRASSRANGTCRALDCLLAELDELCRALVDHRGIIPLYTERETAMAPAIRERVRETRQEDVALLAEAKSRGELPDVDPAMTAAALNGAVWGLLRTSANADAEAFLRIPAAIDELILAPLRHRAPRNAGSADPTSSG